MTARAVDLDGGACGRADEVCPADIEKIRAEVSKGIAELRTFQSEMSDTEACLRAIEFENVDKETASGLFDSAILDVPEGIEVFGMGGVRLFPIYQGGVDPMTANQVGWVFYLSRTGDLNRAMPWRRTA